jgi:mono/diheme cytochrome c family protein
MPRLASLSTLSLGFILFACAAAAQEAQEELAASGRDFALKVCANCHIVEKGQKPPLLKPPAPAFSSILERRDVDEAWLRSFLTSRHANLGRSGKMPNPQLADFEIDKTVAYLLQRKNGH